MVWSRWQRSVLAVALAAVLVTAGCGAAPAPRPAHRGTVTFAMSPGRSPYWIFPIPTPNTWYVNNFLLEEQLYRPLYWVGRTGQPVVNERLSLADLPTYSNGGRTLTITLKPYRWSDGRPVTSRDVEMWINLVSAEKGQYGPYLPGLFPSNLRHVSYPNPRTVVMTFDKAFNHTWLLLQQLSFLDPLPQQAWDRTAAAGPIGNYDRTPGGARAVYRFLARQSGTPGTYTSNPLWKVVDGPWRLTAYDATTGLSVFRPNPGYSGPDRAKLAKFELVPFTSDSAEFNALRSGQLTYGYVPFTDVSQIGLLRRQGFQVAPWKWETTSMAEVNFTNPATKAILHQLYIRQALERLVDQPLYIRDVWHGYATPTYGPVPTVNGSTLADRAEHSNLYPFSVAAARRLLAAHGWAIHPGGADTCSRPGGGAGQCGAGVRAGSQLALTFIYSSGDVPLDQEVQAYKSAASGAGVDIRLDEHSVSEMYSLTGVCPTAPPCRWDLNTYSPAQWNWGPGGAFPSAEQIWGTGNYWGGGYHSAEVDHLIASVRTAPGLAPLYRLETYLAQQVVGLWLPLPDYQISAIRTTLHGALPQDIYAQIDPATWSLAG
ncbi:MAG TPA: ABC transporter substrate-binding protein [Candidatus Micrarchaeia archaeon]|nr:ABC transporter substrate-binding protein [Candidatus Micrarchaeia archaeon]